MGHGIKLLLASVLAMSCISVQAQGQLQAQIQGQQQAQSQAQDVSTNVSVAGDSGTHFPKLAPSAIAPSVSTGVDCAIATADSKAFSLFFISFSGTTGVSYNDICYAFKRQQFEVSDTLMCQKSNSYAEANTECRRLLLNVAKRKSDYEEISTD